MTNFKDTHWVWDRSKGSKGVAYLGVDFNINADIEWFNANIPLAIAPYFDALEIGLVRHLPGHSALAIEDNTVLLDMAWLKMIVECQHWDALKEILVHEREHTLQLLENRLIINQATKTYYWDNRAYSQAEVNALYPHLPWEEEAFRAQAEWLVTARHYATVDEALAVIYDRIEQDRLQAA